MDSKINNTQDRFCKEIELEDEMYILNFEKLNDSQIGIICENKYDYLSLYNYSITLTYDELIKLPKLLDYLMILMKYLISLKILLWELNFLL